jgi:hypothetical protein
VLQHWVVLQMDTNVSEVHAATVFMVEVCSVRTQYSSIGMFQGRWSFGPMGGRKEMAPS